MSIIDVEAERIHDIAIIGISIRLPFADELNQFWENLKTGKDCIGELPMERKSRADNYLKYTRKTSSAIKYRKGSYLESVDEFDFEYFNVSTP